MSKITVVHRTRHMPEYNFSMESNQNVESKGKSVEFKRGKYGVFVSSCECNVILEV